jgi:hypothetical protein
MLLIEGYVRFVMLKFYCMYGKIINIILPVLFQVSGEQNHE